MASSTSEKIDTKPKPKKPVTTESTSGQNDVENSKTHQSRQSQTNDPNNDSGEDEETSNSPEFQDPNLLSFTDPSELKNLFLSNKTPLNLDPLTPPLLPYEELRKARDELRGMGGKSQKQVDGHNLYDAQNKQKTEKTSQLPVSDPKEQKNRKKQKERSAEAAD